MPKQNLFIIAIIILFFKVNAQTKTLTIDEVNEIVLTKSNKVKMINNDFTKSKNKSDFYRISLLPKITSSVSFPYQRSISEIIQSDGSQKFIERNFINSVMNINVIQAFPLTGGSFSLTSSINNARDFNNKTSSFSSNWANISYQQSINGFNSFKWNKKINILNKKIDSINNLKEKVKLKYEVSKIYLDAQLYQLKSRLIKENIIKTEGILFELEEKFKFGRVLKVDIEQAKISLEQLNGKLEISEHGYEHGVESLNKMMNNFDNITLILIPIIEEDFNIDAEKTINSIKVNGFDIEKELKLTEVNSNIDKAAKEDAININLQFGMGLNSTANEFVNLYETPSQSQYVTIGARIPIIDWGKTKKTNEIAKLEKENLQLKLQEEELEIKEKIEDLINYKKSLDLQKKSLHKQKLLSIDVTKMYEELLKLGRKTIVEYKTLFAEFYNINVEYQKTINDLYLLKLKINGFNLTF